MNLLRLTFHHVRLNLIFGIIFTLIAGVAHTFLVIGLTQSVVSFIHLKTSPHFSYLISLIVILIITQLVSKLILNDLNKKMLLFLQTQLAEKVLQIPYRKFEMGGKANYYAAFT